MHMHTCKWYTTIYTLFLFKVTEFMRCMLSEYCSHTRLSMLMATINKVGKVFDVVPMRIMGLAYQIDECKYGKPF